MKEQYKYMSRYISFLTVEKPKLGGERTAKIWYNTRNPFAFKVQNTLEKAFPD